MDVIVCQGKELQYCYQYLRRVQHGVSLDAFEANPTKPEGTPEDCLPVLMKSVQSIIILSSYMNAYIYLFLQCGSKNCIVLMKKGKR